MSAHRANYVDPQLMPLVAALKRRYPDVEIAWAFLRNIEGIGVQQSVRYIAPLGRLRELGLVNDAMLGLSANNRRLHITELGDGFHLCEGGLDAQSKPGCCDLSIFTGSAPRELDRMSVRDARRELARIAKKSRRG